MYDIFTYIWWIFYGRLVGKIHNGLMDPMGLVVAQPSPQHDENYQPPTARPRMSEASTSLTRNCRWEHGTLIFKYFIFRIRI